MSIRQAAAPEVVTERELVAREALTLPVPPATEREVVRIRPTQVHARKRGRATLFSKWCKRCGLCVALCPNKVYAVGADHFPQVVRPDRCVACQSCVIHCPDFALVVVAEVAPSNGGSG